MFDKPTTDNWRYYVMLVETKKSTRYYMKIHVEEQRQGGQKVCEKGHQQQTTVKNQNILMMITCVVMTVRR